MTSYVRVFWLHDFDDQPVELLSELDDERFETRKIEIFANENTQRASKDFEDGTTALGTMAVPDLKEIAKDAQFKPEEISKGAFEEIWALGQQSLKFRI